MLKKVHEDKDNDDKIEVPNAATVERWVKWLYRSKFDTFAKLANGPSRDHPESDHLADDQSQLTYSFDIGDVHFVVLNTDSLTTVIDPTESARFDTGKTGDRRRFALASTGRSLRRFCCNV